MFIISINIKPDDPRHKMMETKEKKEWRIKQLIKRVGREKLSSEALNRNLGLKLNIQTIHEIVQDQIDEVLLDRNGLVEDKNKHIEYEQILNLLYADGVPMLTIGGIIFERDQADQVRCSQVAFASPGGLRSAHFGADQSQIHVERFDGGRQSAERRAELPIK